jgi:uncharacterized membrane protein required for colicin V production
MFELPITFLPYINFVLIALLILGVIAGYKRGFILSLLDVLGLVLAIFLSHRFAPQLAASVPIVRASEITQQFSFLGMIVVQYANTIVWFFILFALINLSYLLLRPLLKGFNKVPLLGGLNRLLGAAFGGLKWLFYGWLISLLLSTPIFANGQVFVENSLLANYRTYLTQIPDFVSLDVQLFDKLLRNESLNAQDEASLKGWFEELFTQEDFQTNLDTWFEQGLINETHYERFMDWFSDANPNRSFDQWWDSVKP